MRLFFVIGFSLLFVLFDFILSIGCFGFYHNSFGFNITTLNNNLFLFNGYYFTKSGFDFVILAVLRFTCLMSTLVVLNKFGVIKKFSLIYLGSDICNTSFTITKILAFAENQIQLTYFGIWMSVIWTIVAQLLVHLFYSQFLCVKFTERRSSRNNYDQLHNQSIESVSIQQNGDIENSTVDEPKRASTLTHVILLMKYCLFYWQWFTTGFVFLILYAIGMHIFIFLNFFK